MPQLNKITNLIIHHTAVSYQIQPDQFDSVNMYHKVQGFPISSLGFFGGYNYIISADGSLKQYRVDGEETAAVKGQNFNSISIALCGNFDIERPTSPQMNTLKSLILDKMTKYAILPNQVAGHRAFANKSCPGRLISDSEIKDFFQPDRGYFTKLLESLKQQLLSLKQTKAGCVDK